MKLLIGMDEAGYGPNLGPLVVAATAWHLERPEVGGRRSGLGCESLSAGSVAGLPATRIATAEPRIDDQGLYARLTGVVARAPADGRVAIADSKALYKPGHGLRQLERGVHATLAAIGQSAPRWSALVDNLAADPARHRERLAWHDGFDLRLPVDATGDEISSLATRLREECDHAGVRPLVVRARLVFPAEFNELTAQYGSKGAALSHVTIGLLSELLGALRSASRLNGPVRVVCDKHGGRNRYHSLLEHHFPDEWIDTLVESRSESRYHWGSADAGVDVAFRAGGEAFLPAALASMTAKYLRELAMRALNRFWCERVPGLRATAGYPLDARRFKVDIATAQRELGIEDHLLWRNR